ncbi:Uu.00g137440.m01.CDS01 [Anthostomella pinea]|uniref:Uu.00g137440.m01.CDS01 n=1 Tax=Anthostomella pinea TaxID=933095 RepID=A0AAI8YKZ5_9PEZI|nr:Uu.00g137440.m01.CDS01 [Anthostomella pinea]
MKSPTTLLLVAAALGLAKADADPTPPPLTHLLTASVIAGTTITIGPEAGGTRVALPIAGGTFTGPRLNGTFLPVGVDAGLMTADGQFYPDGTSVLQTSDGANIIFRGSGYQTGDNIYGAVTFQTGAEQYAWLNTVVAVSSAVLSADGSGSGIALNIFTVGDGNT